MTLKIPLELQYSALIDKTLQNLERGSDREEIRVSIVEIGAAIENNPSLTVTQRGRLRRRVQDVMQEFERHRLHLHALPGPEENR